MHVFAFIDAMGFAQFHWSIGQTQEFHCFFFFNYEFILLHLHRLKWQEDRNQTP